MHKFLDDTTLSEVVPKGQPNAMQLYVARVAEWSLLNHMNINFNKTKEVIIGTLSNSPPPVISINNNTIQRVSNFKLLGVTLDRTLEWHSHINLICNNASSRLYFLKQLRRNHIKEDDLFIFLYCFYSTGRRVRLPYLAL
jgi:hypothetical protein